MDLPLVGFPAGAGLPFAGLPRAGLAAVDFPLAGFPVGVYLWSIYLERVCPLMILSELLFAFGSFAAAGFAFRRFLPLGSRAFYRPPGPVSGDD